MRNPDGSWEKFDDYVVDFALDAAKSGKRFALVTLVLIDGSSPRALGAQMAVDQDGEWVGYLSGGCIEQAIVTEATEAIREGRNRRIRYGKGSPYIDIQLPCGSAIELLFDVKRTEQEMLSIDRTLLARQEGRLTFDGTANSAETENLSLNFLPRRRLIIFGTGPVAVLLCRLAVTSAFEVVLYSNEDSTLAYGREAGADAIRLLSKARAPNVAIDARTAIAFLFHDHDWEEELLPIVIASEAFYIGAIGSRRTHAQRVERLRARGVETADVDRIHGPAGIFGGSKSAADIALSILAQVVQLDRHANDDRIDQLPFGAPPKVGATQPLLQGTTR
ncbi:cytoplasmatic protein CoxI [Ensifer sp. NM-2]|uniref:XdhC family protein n=1 Tax=Ensifer sp. NM-2 TaxID=2109730 RepID=UPI000D12003B|nr:XdhC family protein [Ensifer sp. NM-2]PSS60551.1 cytoplasmatic protein CoxI [Ensifer sp. NM-2]